jgi:hypothetical protein
MSRPGFLNDNEARAYPFIPDGGGLSRGGEVVALPYTTIVDFGCIVGLDSGFDDLQHAVTLDAVARVGNVFTFDFVSDAPGLIGSILRFTRTLADPEYAVEEAENDASSGDLSCTAISTDPLWEGFLVTGILDDLAALLPSGDRLVAIGYGPTIEPALIQNLSRGYVRTMNLANEDRTRVDEAVSCSSLSSASLGDPVPPSRRYRTIINAECLHGPLALRQGYNCVITQNARDNSITISASVAAGAGQPCEEVKLAPRERPPAGSRFLTGGPACNEVITGLNGLSGGLLELVPLRGVRITPSTTRPNTLVVDFDLRDLAACVSLDLSNSLPGGG